MRILAVGLVTVLTLTAPQAPGPRDAAPAPAGTSTITGRVVVAGGSGPVPVRRARVVAEINGAQLPADTDITGVFKFSNAPAGTYRLRAEKPGFVMPEPWQRGVAPTPAPVSVKNGETAIVTITMLRGSAFEGRVMTSRGEPAMNVVVGAVRLKYGPYGRLPVPIKQTRTDDRGYYRVHSLPAGDYYIEAGPDPSDVLAQRTTATGLAKLLYPGTARPSEAQKLTVAVGADVVGLDLTLTSVPLGSLNGTVRDSSGRPVNAMGLRIQRVGGPSGEVRASYLGETGQFFSRGIAPGEYWLSVGVTNAATKAPELFIQKIAIAATANLQDVTTAAGVPVVGRLETADGSPLPPNLSMAALETEFELALPPPLATSFNRAPVAADGAFAFPYLPNPRMLRVNNLAGGWAMAGVTLENADITDTPMAFAAGTPPGALRVILTKATGTLSGTVTDGRQPLSSARVVVFAEDEKRWTLFSRFVQTVESGAGGAFVVEGLLPGKYRAVAVDGLEDGGWNDPEILRALWGRATAIEIAAGSAATISLVVRERP